MFPLLHSPFSPSCPCDLFIGNTIIFPSPKWVGKAFLSSPHSHKEGNKTRVSAHTVCLPQSSGIQILSGAMVSLVLHLPARCRYPGYPRKCYCSWQVLPHPGSLWWWNNGTFSISSQRCQCPDPWSLCMSYLPDAIRLRISRWSDDPGLSEGAHCNHNVLHRRDRVGCEEL